MQVTIDDATQAERRITTLMGNKAELRKRWIEQNIQFTLEDDFSVAGGKE
jgi:topoisomerase-4 subunit B